MHAYESDLLNILALERQQFGEVQHHFPQEIIVLDRLARARAESGLKVGVSKSKGEGKGVVGRGATRQEK
jgi:hypothetical protein